MENVISLYAVIIHVWLKANTLVRMSMFFFSMCALNECWHGSNIFITDIARACDTLWYLYMHIHKHWYIFHFIRNTQSSSCTQVMHMANLKFHFAYTHTHWIGRPAYFVADNCSRILVYGARLQPTAPPPPHNKEKLLKWCSLLRWKDNLTLSKKLASGRHNAAGVFFSTLYFCSSNSRIEMEKFSFYFELNFHLSENFLVWKFYKDIYML